MLSSSRSIEESSRPILEPGEFRQARKLDNKIPEYEINKAGPQLGTPIEIEHIYDSTESTSGLTNQSTMDLKAFIVSAEACQTLLDDLRLWLERNEKTPERPTLSQASDVNRESSFYGRNDDASDEIAATEGQELFADSQAFSIISQLQLMTASRTLSVWTPKWSVMNHMKGMVEDFLGTSWIWWPFRQRQRELADGYTRLRWLCGCERERFADVPTNLVPYILKTVRREGSSTADRQSLQSVESGSSRIPLVPQNKTVGSNLWQPRDPKNSPSHNGVRISPHREKNIESYIFLVVPSGLYIGDEQRLAQRTIAMGTSDDDLFCWIREQYFLLRGRLGAFMSIRIYSHCDFYMFHKYDAEMYSPVEQHSFPGNELPYDFSPKPMDPVLPISDDQFYHRFYACYNPTSLHRLFHKCRKRCGDRADVGSFPLRRHGLQVEDTKKEYFWGIYVVTRVSNTRVAVYSSLCCLPGLVFFFLWMFSWGHSGDLQNASVPLCISLALLVVFLSFVILDSFFFQATVSRHEGGEV
ncbi:hypothetical protein BN1723_003282 [Verticillium longisporum]|uniref:Uncharacterized protein n=2 Tax=Verticillium longisporum TaxID=100787 RepID=A0A0G4LTS0_VERLO|nr:hypothetical protein BN1723_003282 [Verticillium longisporum]